MKDKYYNLTKPYNEGIEDAPPSWMDQLFETKVATKTEKQYPFAGIKDPILNPLSNGIIKKKAVCSKCGCELAANEIGICSNCNM